MKTWNQYSQPAELKSRISVTEYLTWVMHKFIKLPLSNLKHSSWEWSDLSVAQGELTKLKETILKKGKAFWGFWLHKFHDKRHLIGGIPTPSLGQIASWSSKCDLPKLKKNSSTAFHICPASSSFLSLKASLRANSGVVEWQLLINRSIHPQRNSCRKHQGSDPQKGKCKSFHVSHQTMSLLHASPWTKRYSGSAWSVTNTQSVVSNTPSVTGQSTTNMACLSTNAVMPWSASFHFSSCLKKLKFICKLVNTNECRFLHSQSHFSSASVHWGLDFSSLLLLRRLGRRRVKSKVPSNKLQESYKDSWNMIWVIRVILATSNQWTT